MIGELAALGAAISWVTAPMLYRKALLKTVPISANIIRCVSNAAVLALVLVAVGGAATFTTLRLDVMVMVASSGI